MLNEEDERTPECIGLEGVGATLCPDGHWDAAEKRLD